MAGRVVSRLPSISLPRSPRWQIVRRRLLLGLIAVALLVAFYMLWLRDSSLVRVNDVKVVGAENDAAVAAALESAGREQTTLNVDLDALRAAVADEPSVAGLTADADFPHGLTIDVQLREPVGFVGDGGGTLLAGDGTVLRTGVDPPDGIPAIEGEVGSGAVAEGDALTGALVLAGLPPVLAPQVDSVAIDPELGPVVTLNGGVEVRFGDATRSETKWKAVAAVIADPSFDSANYIDVSVPGRPVSG